MGEPVDIAFDLRIAARLVAAVFDLPSEAFTGLKKGPPVHVHARQVLCYLLHTDGGFEQARIARALGRHRSTVGHAVEIVTAMRDDDSVVDRALGRLGEMYRDLRDARDRIPDMVEELAP